MVVKRAGLAGTLIGWCLVSGGCPIDSSGSNQSAIDVKIGITTTQGEAPLRITVTGAGSSSKRGAITKYSWDFAGEASSEGVTAMHTFTRPGRYPIKLTVTDVWGEQAVGQIYVRVSGGPVTAVITADKLSGAAPLIVQFSGADSSATDDVILDYHWDFGDGSASRVTSPLHTFQKAGTYAVKLKAVSAGGVEGHAETAITVTGSAAAGCLQFNGAQYASLPVAADSSLSAFTVEIWCNPDADGGTVVTFGIPNLSIDVIPGTGIAIRSGGSAFYVGGAILAGRWQHVALSYKSGEGFKAYLNGAAMGTAALEGNFAVTLVSLGAGYRGKLARVRFWSSARTEAEIAADVYGVLTGFEEGLLGDWPLDRGQGQVLTNKANGGQDGTRGLSTADEAADPAWSNDGP